MLIEGNSPFLECLLPVLGRSIEGVKTIGVLRRTCKTVDKIINISQRFKESFETRPFLYRAFRLNTPSAILDDLYFRMKGGTPEILKYADQTDLFGNFCGKGELQNAVAMIPSLDISEYNSEGNAPIHFACKNGDVSLVLALLERGADFNQPTLNGDTPIGIAICYNKIEIVEFLLSLGTDPNGTHWGENPLIKTFKSGRKISQEMINLLMSKGCDPTRRDSNGDSILYFAKGIHFDAIKLLVEKWNLPIDLRNNKGQNALWKFKNPILLNYLLKKGLDPHEKDENGQTPFTFAIEKYCPPHIEAFMKVDPCLNDINIFQTLATHYSDWVFDIIERRALDPLPDVFFEICVKDAPIETLYCLIAKGYGEKIAHFAALGSRKKVFPRLLDHINMALQLVLGTLNFEMAEYLLTLGADFNQADCESLISRINIEEEENDGTQKTLFEQMLTLRTYRLLNHLIPLLDPKCFTKSYHFAFEILKTDNDEIALVLAKHLGKKMIEVHDLQKNKEVFKTAVRCCDVRVIHQLIENDHPFDLAESLKVATECSKTLTVWLLNLS